MSEKFFMALLGLGALAFCASVCGPNALRLRKLARKVELARAKARALGNERAELLGRKSALVRRDELVWEALVRERLGWVRPGEIRVRGDSPPRVR